jgi:transposase
MRCTRTRGKKGILHPDPDDPPRRRANKQPGHGTFANDRPPVAGVVGRQSGRMRLRVVGHSDRATLEPLVVVSTCPGAVVDTDEWSAYDQLPEHGRGHATVCHAAHEWARDDDGDGVREVHCNTQEGGWTGLRNFLRIFRGISKYYLHQYVAIFEWSYIIKAATVEFLRALLGVRVATDGRT